MGYDRNDASIDDISPARRAVDRAIIGLIEGFLDFFGRHWLFILNSLHSALVGIALLVPVLSYFGLSTISSPIFRGYGLICHQLPHRSDFLLGFQVPICQRDVAIYVSLAAAGIGFSFVRARLRPLPWPVYIVLILPLAIDGLAQLFGFHESNWALRTFTGGLFGAATVWLAYPHLQVGMEEMRESLGRG